MKFQFYFLSYVDDILVLRMFLEKYFDLSFVRLRWVFFFKNLSPNYACHFSLEK